MQTIKLTTKDILYLRRHHPDLRYYDSTNKIEGSIEFELKYHDITITDNYEIEIDLSHVSDSGLPIVKETAGKIKGIAKSKKMPPVDFHIISDDGEMCMIIPPLVKERYPNGFNLVELLKHIEEHLYWVSYYAKYSVKPWAEYGHGLSGYRELYKEQGGKYASDLLAAYLHTMSINKRYSTKDLGN